MWRDPACAESDRQGSTETSVGERENYRTSKTLRFHNFIQSSEHLRYSDPFEFVLCNFWVSENAETPDLHRCSGPQTLMGLFFIISLQLCVLESKWLFSLWILQLSNQTPLRLLVPFALNALYLLNSKSKLNKIWHTPTTGHFEDACKGLSNSVHGLKLKPCHIHCIVKII